MWIERQKKALVDRRTKKALVDRRTKKARVDIRKRKARVDRKAKGSLYYVDMGWVPSITFICHFLEKEA